MERQPLYKSKRQRLDLIRAELITPRDQLRPKLQKCGDFILPHRVRFNLNDQQQVPDMSNIIDGSPSQAAAVCEAGLTSSIIPSARPWFNVTIPDRDLAEWGPAKEWLHDARQVMVDALLRSNFYTIGPTTLGDISTFATGAQCLVEDFDTVMNAMSFPIGEFAFGVDHRGRVNVFQRDCMMTVRQIVEKWGVYDDKTGRPMWEVFSPAIRNAWDNSNYGQMREIRHVIEPNLEYDARKSLSKYKKYYECYYEASAEDGRFLKEMGYDYFPVQVPRWKTVGHDAWGTDCPGFRAIGDTQQLQFGEEMGLQALELVVRPPMKAHSSLDGNHTSQLPGGVTFTDSPEHFQPLMNINPDLQKLEFKQTAVRQRVDGYYFKDLFSRILSDTRNERATAAEILEGKEEKFVILAPTLSQVDKDLLDPTVNTAFLLCMRQKKFRPAPKELGGMPIQIQYINLASQAQKMIGISVMDRFLSFQERIIRINPSSADKFDCDQHVDEYGESLGVSPRLIRTDDHVEEIRTARAKAEQAKQAQEAVAQGSQTIKNLSQANTDGDNALTQLMAQANAGSGGGV
jgi:hypothetical protein